MFTRTRQTILAAALVFAPAAAFAQATWQPARPPLVTADNEPWFRAAAPIIWAGDYYYPAGTPRFFSPNEMVRSGSFRGIPLYTDATLDPYSIVYVPIAGGLMQPYERRRDGALAGTTGSTTPAFPPAPATEMRPLPGAAGVAEIDTYPQAPAPPSYARAYDVAPVEREAVPQTPAVAAPSEAAAPRPEPPAPETPAKPAMRSKAVNAVWVTYEGQRWFAGGMATPLGEDRFTEVGRYHGFPVYRRDGDASRIYIPASDGFVAPFTRNRRSKL